MTNIYLNYLISKKAIENLKDVYKEKIVISNDKILLFSNSLSIIKYYQSYHFFSYINYIYDDFSNNPSILFENMINQIRQTNYYSNDILLLYCLAASYITYKLNYKYDFNLMLLYENDLSMTYKKLFKNVKLYTPKELLFLEKMIYKSYSIPKANNMYKLSLRRFLLMINSKTLRHTFKFITNKSKFKNDDFILPKLVEKNDKELVDEFNKLKEKAVELIDIINEYLFFNKPKRFNQYFKRMA